MYFFLLQYYFNFNHMNDSLAPLDIFYKDKKQKDLISDNWVLITAEMKLKKI